MRCLEAAFLQGYSAACCAAKQAVCCMHSCQPRLPHLRTTKASPATSNSCHDCHNSWPARAHATTAKANSSFYSNSTRNSVHLPSTFSYFAPTTTQDKHIGQSISQYYCCTQELSQPQYVLLCECVCACKGSWSHACIITVSFIMIHNVCISRQLSNPQSFGNDWLHVTQAAKPTPAAQTEQQASPQNTTQMVYQNNHVPCPAHHTA